MFLYSYYYLSLVNIFFCIALTIYLLRLISRFKLIDDFLNRMFLCLKVTRDHPQMMLRLEGIPEMTVFDKGKKEKTLTHSY